MNETELAWLAGWIEGEGTFCVTSGVGGNSGKRYQRVCLNAVSTDLDVLEYVRSIAGGRVYGPYNNGTWPNGKPYYQWTLATAAQCEATIRQLLPLMVSARRKEQAAIALATIDAYKLLKVKGT